MLKYETIEELVLLAEEKNVKISELVIEDQALAMEKDRLVVYEKMEIDCNSKYIRLSLALKSYYMVLLEQVKHLLLEL